MDEADALRRVAPMAPVSGPASFAKLDKETRDMDEGNREGATSGREALSSPAVLV